MKEYLQYAFFLDASETMLPCDEGTREFLGGADLDAVRAALFSLGFSSAVTDSTLILGGASWLLRVTPLSGDFAPLGDFRPRYLVTLMNQAGIASIVRLLGSEKPDAGVYARLFDAVPNPLFIDDASGSVLWFNRAYAAFTGERLEQMAGRKLSDLNRSGKLRPIISPTILEARNEITVLQTIGGRRNAVISGIPVFGSSGEPVLILTCLNPISEIGSLSKGDISGANRSEQFSSGGPDNGAISVIAESGAMREILRDAAAIAQYPVPVLITGESGTGKEIIANLIHASGRWRSRPFVRINCPAITPTLLESEMFGYEGGAFTGALAKGKAGLLESADGGTLLLDEIGDMPLETQPKMLRVLQSGEYYRVGGTALRRVNVRIIACTNRSLPDMTRAGLFRQDLYYRLSVICLRIPPLRDRREDIEPLLRHNIYLCNKLYGTAKRMSDELIEALREYPWPGNVRELENVVKRLVITCPEELLTPDSFRSKYGGEPGRADAGGGNPETWPVSLPELVDTYEKDMIERALARSSGTRQAAALLGISQATLLRKRRKG